MGDVQFIVGYISIPIFSSVYYLIELLRGSKIVLYEKATFFGFLKPKSLKSPNFRFLKFLLFVVLFQLRVVFDFIS